MRHAVRHVHFVGIGGAGMSGIAEILHRLGYAVSGSDRSAGESTARLQSLGVKVTIGHEADNVREADVVVVSSAVAPDNPEVAAARARQVPVVPRAVMLAELMRPRQGIAVAGAHGKTTTTSLVAAVLAEGGLDPTYVIGGTPVGAASNCRLGRGEFIVVEADESDASFLHLCPVLAVVTNIDEDHMDTYGHDRERLDAAFVDFLHRLPFYGHAVACVDDPGVRRILPRVQRRVVGYGLDDGAPLRAIEVRTLPGGRMGFVAQRPGRPGLPVTLNLAGTHNVRNALAAIAVGDALGVPDDAVQRALAGFAGVARRFQRCGDRPASGGGRYTVIDDYGHHPAEIAAVLAAARGAFPGRRLVVAFQPHRYTRTRDCFEGFVGVLRQFDTVLLADVYAAGEGPIAGASSDALAGALADWGGAVQYVGPLSAMAPAIERTAQDGDVVITMGAGSIGEVPAQLGVAEEAGA